MRLSAAVVPLLILPGLAAAQDTGVALNMGRGLDNGMSVGWTFKENWTLRPTLGAAYSAQTGFQASVGSTVLRSFGYGHRVYGYLGAGVYYGSANSGSGSGGTSTFGRGGVNSVGGVSQPGSQNNNSVYQANNVAYITAPAGLRARIFGNVELFAETAWQKALSGQFGANQAGQFSNNGRQRLGATFGLTWRLE